ncbi:MAG: hypothetical protein QXT81_05415, partial [Candidatus Bathyarchaeia archaeon]
LTPALASFFLVAIPKQSNPRIAPTIMIMLAARETYGSGSRILSGYTVAIGRPKIAVMSTIADPRRKNMAARSSKVFLLNSSGILDQPPYSDKFWRI